MANTYKKCIIICDNCLKTKHKIISLSDMKKVIEMTGGSKPETIKRYLETMVKFELITIRGNRVIVNKRKGD